MRTLWDFHGGIHPQENKTQSVSTPLVQAPLPSRVILPLQQHIGAPAEPLVKIGDRVRTGQLIARADGVISANIHASLSGTVAAIGDHPIPHASGMSDRCITIESDGQDQWVMLEPVSDWQHADADTLLNAISEAGIVGMGGAGFPTSVKARTRERHDIDTLVINAAECEPYITADDMAMRTYPQQLVLGAQILCKLVDPSSCLIGIEDNKPEAIKALQDAVKGTHIEVVVVPTKYPSGGEKQLIKILTGREVPSGGLPADIGVVCQNVGTTIAIAKAITLGEPLISRITTLTGNAMQQRQNVEVRLGTPIRELLDYAGFDAQKASRLIMGGPMMGFTLTGDQLPVVKTTNCLLAPTHDEFPDPEPESPCIRCGMCEQACPAELLPQQLHWFAKAQEFEKAQLFNLFDCIECGACAYVCPSSIPLVQYYRFAKTEIRNEQEEAKKAERAKIRFEQRQARLEREEAEKIAARNARMAAAAAKPAAGPASSSPAPAANGLDEAAAKKLKIQRAAASVALKKAEKALADATDENRSKLEADLKAAQDKVASIDTQLGGNTNTAAQTPAQANPNGLDEAALKKLKIQRAAASVALKKAEKALAEAADEDKAKLEANLKAAQDKVAGIEQQMGVTPAASAPAPAGQNDAQEKALKQAKIAAAASKAAIKKAEKALVHAQGEGDAEEIAAKEAAIVTAKEHAEKAAEKLKALQDAAKAPAASSSATSSAPDEDAEKALKQAKIAAAAQEKALKQAKIIAAATKTALKKAEKVLADAEASGDSQAISEQQAVVDRCRAKQADAAQKLEQLTQPAGSEV